MDYNEDTSEESEDNFEDGLDFTDAEVNLVPPLPTRQGSPLNEVDGGPTLADNVDDTLEEVQWKLHDIAQVREEIEEVTDLLEDVDTRVGDKSETEQVGEELEESGLVAGENFEEDCELPLGNMPDDAAVVVEYDKANTEDGDKAQDLGRHVKVEFSATDIRFWFGELEGEMLLAGIGKQWLKKTVLQRNLPTKQKEDVKALLTLTQTQAGEDIYFRLKNELIRIYAPKPKDSYCKALTRTMVGLPSQLGNQLVDDICKKPIKLQDCCCPSAVEALWHLQLPVNIRAHVSNMEFSHTTFKEVFEAADRVFLSSKQVSVAAMQVAAVNLDETQAAFNPENQPQVAAIAAKNQGRNQQSNRGRNKPNRGRGGRNGQSQANSQSQTKPRGPRHSSSPPEACCDRHYRHGADAWYCVAPLTCPWVNKCAPR